VKVKTAATTALMRVVGLQHAPLSARVVTFGCGQGVDDPVGAGGGEAVGRVGQRG
jgi:hypothetical protein